MSSVALAGVGDTPVLVAVSVGEVAVDYFAAFNLEDWIAQGIRHFEDLLLVHAAFQVYLGWTQDNETA